VASKSRSRACKRKNCIISVDSNPSSKRRFKATSRCSGAAAGQASYVKYAGLARNLGSFHYFLAPRVKTTHGFKSAIKGTEAACQSLPNKTKLGAGRCLSPEVLHWLDPRVPWPAVLFSVLLLSTHLQWPVAQSIHGNLSKRRYPSRVWAARIV